MNAKDHALKLDRVNANAHGWYNYKHLFRNMMGYQVNHDNGESVYRLDEVNLDCKAHTVFESKTHKGIIDTNNQPVRNQVT